MVRVEVGEGSTLKERIHNTRVPLKSRWAKALMGLVYFTLPIVAGFGIMKLTNKKQPQRFANDTIHSEVTTRINKERLGDMLEEAARSTGHKD